MLQKHYLHLLCLFFFCLINTLFHLCPLAIPRTISSCSPLQRLFKPPVSCFTSTQQTHHEEVFLFTIKAFLLNPRLLESSVTYGAIWLISELYYIRKRNLAKSGTFSEMGVFGPKMPGDRHGSWNATTKAECCNYQRDSWGFISEIRSFQKINNLFILISAFIICLSCMKWVVRSFFEWQKT